MEPDYASYSTTDLEDALRKIDQATYPERTKHIQEELKIRAQTVPTGEKKAEDFDTNEQFYKCPHCEKKIGFFSRTNNSFGRIKHCPHCQQPFESKISAKAATAILIPLVLMNLLVFRPVLESLAFSKFIGTAFVIAVVISASFRFRKLPPQTVN
ncbi:hypothetical protein [Alteromonas confluentis]|uniref:Uncharacterized protein n=1 Tax=Alteromonas confluentis TaxID=1656094 RepID=A0A1E7Z919_9ALTE|nr:hypothetical protein [Alteromonas confluentis]OFC70025.1 hypothetical protein BFC18_15725 [Alteromonas confluentis]